MKPHSQGLLFSILAEAYFNGFDKVLAIYSPKNDSESPFSFLMEDGSELSEFGLMDGRLEFYYVRDGESFFKFSLPTETTFQLIDYLQRVTEFKIDGSDFNHVFTLTRVLVFQGFKETVTIEIQFQNVPGLSQTNDNVWPLINTSFTFIRRVSE